MAIGSAELLGRLKTDPEFEGKIPPLTEAEFAQLRENILDAGEVYEPIRVWNGVVVDGHNRLKVIRENPQVRWQTKDMEFADKWAAFEWMYKNQLGRRNLTDEQRTYMIGKMYEARKNTVGGDRGNERSEDGRFSAKSQNANLRGARTPRTDEIIGEEVGVNHATVSRAYKFAKGIDMLRAMSPESADKVLAGKSRANKSQIATLAEVALESREQAVSETASAIAKGDTLPAITRKPGRGRPKKQTVTEARPSSTTANTQTGYGSDGESKDPYDAGCSTYNIDDLVEEVKLNGEDYLRAMRTLIETRFPQFDKAINRMKIRREIDVIIDGFTALKEELR